MNDIPAGLREKRAVQEIVGNNHILVHYIQDGKVHIMSSMIYYTKEDRNTYNNAELNAHILLMCENLMNRFENHQKGENQDGIGTR